MTERYDASTQHPRSRTDRHSRAGDVTTGVAGWRSFNADAEATGQVVGRLRDAANEMRSGGWQIGMRRRWAQVNEQAADQIIRLQELLGSADANREEQERTIRRLRLLLGIVDDAADALSRGDLPPSKQPIWWHALVGQVRRAARPTDDANASTELQHLISDIPHAD